MNVYELAAKITLDDSEYQKGLQDNESKTQSFGEKLKGGLSTAGKVGAAAFGVATAAVGAAAVAVGKMASASIQSYADYEQLVGGVQKLYGNMGQSLEEYAKSVGKPVDEVKDEWGQLEQAQNMVLENAKNAYKTAGMSANQYMETATSFSAALINSLGGDTVKAAEQTDVAMRAISDNFNTFGGDIEGVQNAFQGFAKGQFNMLDNLKLGYGGTKTEMERLIADANEYAAANGEAADLSIDSFSDIVTAIDLVQRKQKIAGTTAREAGSTIAGSFGMLKGAWANLITGLTDSEADIGQLIDNVVESAETMLSNLLPAVERALGGISELVSKVAPIIAEELPTLVTEVLPALLEAASSLVAGVVAALPAIIQILIQQAPMIISSLVTALRDAFPLIIQAGRDAIQSLSGGMDPKELLTKGLDLIAKLAQGVMNNLPTALTAIGNILNNIISAIMTRLPEFLQQGVQFIGKLAQGAVNNLPAILNAVGKVIGNALKTIISNLPQFLSKGIEIVGKIAAGLIRAVPKVVAAIPSIINGIKNAFAGFDWASIGINLIKGIAGGIARAARNLVDSAVGAVKQAFGAQQSYLDSHSPSRKAEKEIGKMWSAGIGIGFVDDMEKETGEMVNAVDKTFQALKGVPTLDGYEVGTAAGSFAPIINVYGAEGQDVEDLANIVMDKIVTAYGRKRVSYGLA